MRRLNEAYQLLKSSIALSLSGLMVRILVFMSSLDLSLG